MMSWYQCSNQFCASILYSVAFLLLFSYPLILLPSYPSILSDKRCHPSTSTLEDPTNIIFLFQCVSAPVLSSGHVSPRPVAPKIPAKSPKVQCIYPLYSVLVAASAASCCRAPHASAPKAPKRQCDPLPTGGPECAKRGGWPTLSGLC
jgi:hypothetical protein